MAGCGQEKFNVTCITKLLVTPVLAGGRWGGEAMGFIAFGCPRTFCHYQVPSCSAQKKSPAPYSLDNKTLCQGNVLFGNQGLLQIPNL